MARHGRMISVQHFLLMPHGRPWYLPTQNHWSVPAFVFYIWGGRGTSYPPQDPEVYFKHSDQTMRMDRAWGGSLAALTFTEILRFVKGRRWSICWLEGTEASCQRRGFGLNIKHVFFFVLPKWLVLAANLEIILFFRQLSRKWSSFLVREELPFTASIGLH